MSVRGPLGFVFSWTSKMALLTEQTGELERAGQCPAGARPPAALPAAPAPWVPWAWAVAMSSGSSRAQAPISAAVRRPGPLSSWLPLVVASQPGRPSPLPGTAPRYDLLPATASTKGAPAGRLARPSLLPGGGDLAVPHQSCATGGGPRPLRSQTRRHERKVLRAPWAWG